MNEQQKLQYVQNEYQRIIKCIKTLNLDAQWKNKLEKNCLSKLKIDYLSNFYSNKITPEIYSAFIDNVICFINESSHSKPEELPERFHDFFEPKNRELWQQFMQEDKKIPCEFISLCQKVFFEQDLKYNALRKEVSKNQYTNFINNLIQTIYNTSFSEETISNFVSQYPPWKKQPTSQNNLSFFPRKAQLKNPVFCFYAGIICLLTIVGIPFGILFLCLAAYLLNAEKNALEERKSLVVL